MKPDGLDVLQTKEWRELIVAPPSASNRGLVRQLAPRLESSDVSSLIRHLGHARGEDVELTAELLHAAVRAGVSFSAQQKQDLMQALRPLVAAYAHEPVGQPLALMKLLDWAATSQLLLEEVDGMRIAEWRFRGYMIELAGSPSATDRILQYSTLPGSRGKTAIRRLKLMGLLEESELKQMAKHWRETGSLQTLNDLYEFYIVHNLFGKPIERLLELLGPPESHASDTLSYNSSDKGGPGWVFFIENGNLVSSKTLDGRD